MNQAAPQPTTTSLTKAVPVTAWWVASTRPVRGSTTRSWPLPPPATSSRPYGSVFRPTEIGPVPRVITSPRPVAGSKQ